MSQQSNEPAAPSAEEIRTARLAAGMTQDQAAAAVHVTVRMWTHWECGTREMPLARWELFRAKIGGASIA